MTSPDPYRRVADYLESQQSKGLLRFITCGSVDDGKSTLIGRLLFDSKLIYEDQLAALENDSKNAGTQHGKMDLALLVDGLTAEREQGITIDFGGFGKPLPTLMSLRGIVGSSVT